MFYEIHDTYGAPQCGCEVTRFAEWWEVEEYLDRYPGVMERVHDMYATITERDEPCYLLCAAEYPTFSVRIVSIDATVVLPEEIPGMYAEAIEYGYGDESTLESWLFDMERQGILTYHD